MNIPEIHEEYEDDLSKFGFEQYGIDFSFIPADDVEALCEWIRNRNKENKHKEVI